LDGILAMDFVVRVVSYFASLKGGGSLEQTKDKGF